MRQYQKFLLQTQMKCAKSSRKCISRLMQWKGCLILASHPWKCCASWGRNQISWRLGWTRFRAGYFGRPSETGDTSSKSWNLLVEHHKPPVKLCRLTCLATVNRTPVMWMNQNPAMKLSHWTVTRPRARKEWHAAFCSVPWSLCWGEGRLQWKSCKKAGIPLSLPLADPCW